MRGRRWILPAALIVLGGCGYFNSLYNANRSFAMAEHASRSGDGATAAREYRSAIERAAVSYRKYPDSRWADDALLLLGRARFALDEHDPAAAALRTLLDQSADASMRSIAHAYLGASLLMLDDVQTAAVHLDSAVHSLDAGSETGAFARLWRARVAIRDMRSESAWPDLAAALGNGRVAHDAALEGVRHALVLRDSARALEFMQHLAATAPDQRTAARVDTLLARFGDEWSPSIAFTASAPLAESGWPAEVRDRVKLARARLAVAAGDTDTGLELATQVGNAVSLGIGSRARRLAGEILIARAATADDLEEVRTLLLPAYDDRAALDLMRRVRAAQILLSNGQDPASSISLFAAAELLRDEVGAPHLARRVFLDFATLQQNSAWAGKAALAAHQIGPTEETAAALERLAGNAYVRAARGGAHDPADIDAAEARLAFGIAGLRAEALAEAVRRDVVVGRAVTVLDSTRAAARSDSVRIACGMLIDSLSIAGIRADSTRTACFRGDTARVRFVLGVDTVLLRDTVVAAPVPGRVVPDTVLRPDTFTIGALHR